MRGVRAAVPPSAAWRLVGAADGFEVVHLAPGLLRGHTSAVEGGAASAVSDEIALDDGPTRGRRAAMADDTVPGVAPGWSGAPAGSHDVAQQVLSALDPVLVDRDFAPGQAGVHATGVGVVYCTPHRDARRRFPALAALLGTVLDTGDPDPGVTRS